MIHAVAIWVLLTVVWQGDADPDIAFYPMNTAERCAKAADSFSAAEQLTNMDIPPTLGDHWVATCVLANGGDTDAL